MMDSIGTFLGWLLVADTTTTADDSVLSDWYPGVFLVAVIVFAYTLWRRRRRERTPDDPGPDSKPTEKRDNKVAEHTT